MLKTINSRFVTVAPTKVERIAAHDVEIANLDFVGNHFRFQRSLSRPFIHALCAGAYASQSGRVVVAHSVIRPGDSQLRTALLRNLARLDCLLSLYDVNHSEYFVARFAGSRRRAAAPPLKLCVLRTNLKQRCLNGFGFYLPV